MTKREILHRGLGRIGFKVTDSPTAKYTCLYSADKNLFAFVGSAGALRFNREKRITGSWSKTDSPLYRKLLALGRQG